MSKIEQKYIVIVFYNGTGRDFSSLISCDFFAITQYVSNLKIGSDIRVCFYNIERLNDIQSMDTGDAIKTIYMNSEKTYSDFDIEIRKALKELEIAVEKEEKEKEGEV